MNTQELIGCTAKWRVHELTIRVKILEAITRFGRVDVKITPIGGSGERWVNSDLLLILEDGKEESNG